MLSSADENFHNKPAGALPVYADKGDAKLLHIPPLTLARELLYRMRTEAVWPNDSDNTWMGYQLLTLLKQQLQVHNNRFGAKRLADLFNGLFHQHAERPSLNGATVVDLGCGSMNPFGFMFLFLCMGAERAVAVDMDEIYDMEMAVRSMADIASAMLIDPSSIVGDADAPGPAQVMENLKGFDLPKLGRGDASGINQARLQYRRESVGSMTIEDGSASFVTSVAFLEHVVDVDAALADMVRISKPGGLGVHIIDFTDHRRYGEGVHAFEFLTEPQEGMARGSNRLRRSQFRAAFERAGFNVLRDEVGERVELPHNIRARLSPAFEGLSDDDLTAAMVQFVVQRV